MHIIPPKPLEAHERAHDYNDDHYTQSLYTTEHAYNYIDNQYKQLNTHTIPYAMIINY